jgi:hypothetical protein
MTENKGITFPENVTVIRVPSLSWRDYKYELDYTKQEGKLRPWHLFAFPLATTLGRLFDFTFRLLAGSHSDGKWSWAITSFPTLIFIHLLNRNAPIFATGGPSVAQLVSATIGRLFRARITLEFQDPFLGAEMKLPQRTLAALKKMERYIIESSTTTFFVTKTAADRAIARHVELSSKIKYSYPSAWNFKFTARDTLPSTRNVIEFLHVGTLYGSRNLDLFFLAIDDLLNRDCIEAGEYIVTNLGGLHLENRNTYLSRQDFHLVSNIQREDALLRANSADILLLVQHQDSRSLETIPFKTYDYFNLQKPILGILNNPELEALVQKHQGIVSNANSMESISAGIQESIKRTHAPSTSKGIQTLSAVEQWSKLSSEM